MNHFKRSKILPLLVAGFFLNAALDALIILIYGWNPNSILSCALISILTVISYIDLKTMRIPPLLNLAVLILGVLQTFFDSPYYLEHILGMLLLGFIIFIIMLLSGGRAIGGGDLKLMAGIGLFFGWQGGILCFVIACFTGAVCHLVRMKIKGDGEVFALAPYISFGVVISLLWGERILAAYMAYL